MARLFLVLPFLLASLICTGHASDRPNVVFIIVDDLNALPLHPGAMPAAPTPNIDRLARRGVSFANAHTNDPICAPSRATLMFGLYPQTSGLYWFENWRENGILNRSVSLNRHLQQNGYGVYGTGKIYHGAGDRKGFDEYGLPISFGPWPWDGRKETARGFLPHPDQQYLLDADPDMPYQWEHHFGPLSNVPHWPADPETGAPGYEGWRLFGKPWKLDNDGKRDLLPDELYAQFARDIISRDHQKPFALFTGLVRTHTPLYAPKEYFDRFPLDSIEMPKTLDGDTEDLAAALGDPKLYGFRRYRMLARHPERDLLRKWVQAYLACVSFVDDQVGAILDAVEASPSRDNTIVILTSDHGFHMGDKEFLYKQSLWDGATRVPLIVAGVEGAPRGATCNRPVSLVDLYPTFIELCDLPKDPNKTGNSYHLDGHSLKPLLLDPEAGEWTGPDVAITALPGKDHMHLKQHDGTPYPHFSVRSTHWRYTLCSNGEEELYNFKNDPLEWHNLANDPTHAATKAALKKKLLALRDGDAWESINAESASPVVVMSGTRSDFEWEGEIRTSRIRDLRIRYHANVSGQDVRGVSASIPHTRSDAKRKGVAFNPASWNRYRIRVLGDRCQVWINNQVYSDTRGQKGTGQMVLVLTGQAPAESAIELRGARIRDL